MFSPNDRLAAEDLNEPAPPDGFDSEVVEYAGAFFVEKVGKDQLRLVLDGRISNRRFTAPVVSILRPGDLFLLWRFLLAARFSGQVSTSRVVFIIVASPDVSETVSLCPALSSPLLFPSICMARTSDPVLGLLLWGGHGLCGLFNRC